MCGGGSVWRRESVGRRECVEEGECVGVYGEEGEMHVLAEQFQVSSLHDQVVTQINQPKLRRYCDKGIRKESSP